MNMRCKCEMSQGPRVKRNIPHASLPVNAINTNIEIKLPRLYDFIFILLLGAPAESDPAIAVGHSTFLVVCLLKNFVIDINKFEARVPFFLAKSRQVGLMRGGTRATAGKVVDRGHRKKGY